MIVIGSVLAIVLIGAYIFLGMKISESIVNGDVKIFFWALYTVTLLTIVNVSMSIYFYSNIANKKGPLGPRGLKGKIGEKGNIGDCSDVCKTKTVQIMIEEAIQKVKEENDITPKEREFICNKINETTNKSKVNGTHGTHAARWSLQTLKDFKEHIEDRNNYTDSAIADYSIDERIVRQNNGKDTFNWLKNLIEGGATGDYALTGDGTSSECV